MIAVIGIDQYRDWPRLENAVRDAMGVSKLFARLGFEEVTAPLLDERATGEAMRRLVTDDLAKLARDDSLVLFFAGHGHTHTTIFDTSPVRTGCVIPADARRARGHVSSSWLQLDNWLRDIARLPPRHILVIIDSCYSGVALGLPRWRSSSDLPRELATLRSRRSRLIIASALEDQRAMDSGPVPGHSLFTGCLIEGISGRCASTGRRVVTGKELGQYLRQRVSSSSRSAQTPDYGTFDLDRQGDIVVPLVGETAASASLSRVPAVSSAGTVIGALMANVSPVPTGPGSTRVPSPKMRPTAREFSAARQPRSRFASTAQGYCRAPSPFPSPAPSDPRGGSPPTSPASPEPGSPSEPGIEERFCDWPRTSAGTIRFALAMAIMANALALGYLVGRWFDVRSDVPYAAPRLIERPEDPTGGSDTPARPTITPCAAGPTSR